MRYAVAIGYPLRLYVERDRAVQEIERQDCRVTPLFRAGHAVGRPLHVAGAA